MLRHINRHLFLHNQEEHLLKRCVFNFINSFILAVSVPSYVIVEINKASGRVQISLEYNVRVPVNITYFWCEGTKNETGNVYCQVSIYLLNNSTSLF